MASSQEPAAIEDLIKAHGRLSIGAGHLSDDDHLHNLALQILHNLKYQHRWTQLKLHTHSPAGQHDKLPRPMLSGLPPRRLYIHPDEQLEHLKAQAELKKKRKARPQPPPTPDGGPTVAAPDEGVALPPVREWVLPTHIRETWSLKKMAAAFDGISVLPPEPEVGDETIDSSGLRADAAEPVDPWRQTKRLLLATRDDDSTVVYYIVHDGIVKPRQN